MNGFRHMPEKIREIRARRAFLLLLGTTVGSWTRSPFANPRPPESKADEFIVVDGWVLPRHLLDPAHAR